jgi:hypothetical protein
MDISARNAAFLSSQKMIFVERAVQKTLTDCTQSVKMAAPNSTTCQVNIPYVREDVPVVDMGLVVRRCEKSISAEGFHVKHVTNPTGGIYLVLDWSHLVEDVSKEILDSFEKTPASVVPKNDSETHEGTLDPHRLTTNPKMSFVPSMGLPSHLK